MTPASLRPGPAALAALLLLAAGPPARAQAAAPTGPTLPNGNGCAGDIARWQAQQGSGGASGNVDLDVYNRVQNEIDRAATLCEAGQDARAREMVAASKRRHGAPR